MAAFSVRLANTLGLLTDQITVDSIGNAPDSVASYLSMRRISYNATTGVSGRALVTQQALSTLKPLFVNFTITTPITPSGKMIALLDHIAYQNLTTNPWMVFGTLVYYLQSGGEWAPI